MELFPILTDEDHDRALRAIERLWNAPEGTPEFAILDAMATLVDAYERHRWPVASDTPLEFLKGYMDLTGRTQTDLASLLGSRSRASEILSGKRALGLDHIRLLSKYWRIPASLLIGEMVDA